jgi:regulator of protease activity HflC (stomatin/prohibitin superfamily)
MKKNQRILALLFCILIASCTVIRPGEVGFKQKLGKFKTKKPYTGGAVFYNPFVSKIIQVNIRTVEVYENLPLPTKEGLSVDAQIILLYHVKPEFAKDVYTNFGTNYEKVFVVSNFLATAREVSSRYFAKELYAIEREKVEKVIVDELAQHIGSKGFVIDAVLLKDIILPPALSQAILDKVNAEQATLQMEFAIAKQKKEAERLIIEARGIKTAQTIIDSSLTPKMLQYKNLEIMKGLMTSPNAKVIITDGKTPIIQ